MRTSVSRVFQNYKTTLCPAFRVILDENHISICEPNLHGLIENLRMCNRARQISFQDVKDAEVN